MDDRTLYWLEFQGDSCYFNLAAEFMKEYEFANSCNGFLYFQDNRSSILYYRSDYVMFILNPFTGEYLCLPPGTQEGTVAETAMWGLGFCPITNQFKAIRTYYLTADDDFKLRAEVYTLGTGTWRSIGVVPDLGSYSHLALPLTSAYSKVYFNGKCHWVFRDVVGLKLYTFDFESEQFGSMPLPPDVIDNDNYVIADFGVLGETVYLSGYIEPSPSEEIWVMRQYGVAESWTKMSFTENRVNLQNQFYFSKITFFDSKDSLLLCAGNRFYYDDMEETYVRNEGERGERVVVHELRLTSLKNDSKGESSKVLNAGSRLLSRRM